ncbi:MFS domain-containing protein [Mycena chlorophos]|uniref:MFS domain-containing protein n=1 Tax=Mycena chlorophos TaxID=658473 RepID=A0A8H6W2H2_MYCCL|nr:MFS domain-containing protein [Mycena chlorophos]
MASPSEDHWRLRDFALILSVSGVTTLNVFFQGALTVALPTIGNELKFTQEDLQWPLNVYSLAYACSVLFFGRLGDIVGGRVMFLAGSAWFAIWSLLIPFAPTSGALIAFVALTGIGAAANTPSGVGLLATFFPPGPKRNAAYGVMGAGQPLGFILGLLLGGVLTQSKATWRAGFYMQCGLAVFFVFLGFTFIVHQRPPRRYNKGLDWGGVLLSSAGLGMLIYSLADSTTARKGWSTPQIPSLFTGAALILALFIFYERYREARGLSVIVPMNIWNVKLASVLGTLFFSMWSFNLMIYYSTLYYQQINLLTPLQTAVRYIPMTIAGFLVNLIAGSIMNRVQGQPLILVGVLGSIVAPIIFATLNVHGSYWTTMFLVMVITVGPDVVYPVGNLYLSTVFDDDSQALAAGLFAIAMRVSQFSHQYNIVSSQHTHKQLGTSLGLAVTSSIATATSQNYQHAHAQLVATSPEVLMVGYRAAGWTLMAAGIVAFGIAAFGLRGIGIVGRAKEDLKDVAPQVAAAAGIELSVLPGASGGVVSSASSEKVDV